MSEPRWIFFDGEWHNAGEPLVSAESRAVWYGDGCFETFRSYAGKFLELDAHLERLGNGLDYLQIKSPAFNKNGLKNVLDELLEKNSLSRSDAVIRIQVWREGGRGFRVPSDAFSRYSITALPAPEISGTVKLATVSTRRIPSDSVNSQFKLSNSINYIRAASEAEKKGADEALMLTVDGWISETTIANIFWMEENRVYTPSVTCDILTGITRKILIDIIKQEPEVSLREGEFVPADLANAETAWICNSVLEIAAVKSVDELTFSSSHPFIKKVKTAFESYRNKALL